VDGEVCAKIGGDVLRDGGTAVDAAIAALFCNGVVNSQSMGIGGGLLLTIYHAQSKTVHTLNAREMAPKAATENMFHGNSSASQYGPLSVAVPGEIAGYWEAKKRFGSDLISWSRLVAPTVDMCRTGITVSWTHASILKAKEDEIFDPKMREVFFNPATGSVWQEGDVYTRPDFADTLEKLAQSGDEGKERLDFYTGPIGQNLVNDLGQLGGILTMDDLRQYTAEWTQPVKVDLSSANLSVYSVPPPGSGVILAHILNILDELRIEPTDDPVQLAHRIVEAFKWTFASRPELGDPQDSNITELIKELVANMTSEEMARRHYANIDPDRTFSNASHYGAKHYTPQDHGTAHVSVLDDAGNAVSATSTINLYFGSRLMSQSTGIIYNDEMDDFSAPNITNYFGVPPSPNNFIKGGKRPLSSMCPAIVLDGTGRVRLVIGAAGGTKITTATAQAMISNMWLDEDIKTSIDRRRLHHQLAPMKLMYEEDFPQDILRALETKGHRTEEQDKFGSVVVGIARQNDGRLYANADFRKAGGVDGY